MEKYGIFPINNYWLSKGYIKSSHRAIDIGFNTKLTKQNGEDVLAWKSGKVIKSTTDSKGGVYVVIEHKSTKSKRWTAYWHLKKGTNIKVGTQVKQGDKIGIRGNTGISYGKHLHFMLTKPLKLGTKYKYATLEKYAINPIPLCYKTDKYGTKYKLHSTLSEVKDMPLSDAEQIAKLTEENKKLLEEIEELRKKLGI